MCVGIPLIQCVLIPAFLHVFQFDPLLVAETMVWMVYASPTIYIVLKFSHTSWQVIPRSVLENAKGFAIFSVFKAGFLFSARAGSGIVIARISDGSRLFVFQFLLFYTKSAAWSAPSAIGTAGLGFGGQAGAEMTDFLIVLNSRSVSERFFIFVYSFMLYLGCCKYC
jgi:lipid-binding SYLF domain-containing protein